MISFSGPKWQQPEWLKPALHTSLWPGKNCEIQNLRKIRHVKGSLLAFFLTAGYTFLEGKWLYAGH